MVHATNASTEFTRRERAVLDRLRSPAAIQAFLDALPYRTEDAYRCRPRLAWSTVSPPSTPGAATRAPARKERITP